MLKRQTDINKKKCERQANRMETRSKVLQVTFISLRTKHESQQERLGESTETSPQREDTCKDMKGKLEQTSMQQSMIIKVCNENLTRSHQDRIRKENVDIDDKRGQC